MSRVVLDNIEKRHHERVVCDELIREVVIGRDYAHFSELRKSIKKMLDDRTERMHNACTGIVDDVQILLGALSLACHGDQQLMEDYVKDTNTRLQRSRKIRDMGDAFDDTEVKMEAVIGGKKAK